MTSSPYSETALKNCVRVGDSGRWQVDLDNDLDTIVADTALRATTSPLVLNIVEKPQSNGVRHYASSDIETDLILRATYKRLIKQYQIRLPNREAMISGILETLAEASPFVVTRCDVTSFYESIEAGNVVKEIVSDTRTPPQMRRVFDHLENAGVLTETGTPRGLALSGVIAELYLKSFDAHIRKYPGVHRYFRYADDMVIFSLPETEVLDEIQSFLSNLGLSLNDKTTSVHIRSESNSSSALENGEFSFLGYTFSVGQRVKTFESRQFDVSISEQKLKKRQTRMTAALRAFYTDNNAELLLDRLNYITTNQSVYRTRHTRGAQREKIRTGIYYNYAHCGHYKASKKGRAKQPHQAYELYRLDGHLKALLFGSNSIYASRISLLSPQMQAKLRKISFAQGYRTRLNKRFSRARMRQIYRIWGND